jgi:hypothetical protein
MNVTSIAQQHNHNDKSINKTQSPTTNFQDELNKQQGGRWKNHFIEGLSPSQNQALNNKLDEMGITSDEEIYQIKSTMEATMITYESLGWSPSNYTENHIRSLEYSKNMGGLNDIGSTLLEALYAIQENDLKNPSIEDESNKYLSNAMSKLLHDEKNKTIPIENSKQLQIKSHASEYVSFQREIEQSNRDSVLSLSV